MPAERQLASLADHCGDLKNRLSVKWGQGSGCVTDDETRDTSISRMLYGLLVLKAIGAWGSEGKPLNRSSVLGESGHCENPSGRWEKR